MKKHRTGILRGMVGLPLIHSLKFYFPSTNSNRDPIRVIYSCIGTFREGHSDAAIRFHTDDLVDTRFEPF
jgi:hypothetical protein